MPIYKPEKTMKSALKEAGHTITEYIEPAPGEEDRDPEATFDEIMSEIDNDRVGQAIAQSDEAEARDKPHKPANDPAPPPGKTGS